MAKFKLIDLKNSIHLYFYVLLTINCFVASLLCQKLDYCYWKFMFILLIEIHSAPAFTVIYLCLSLLHIIGKKPSVSLCVVFDVLGFSVHLIAAILQLWAYCAQFDIMNYYRQTGLNDVLGINEAKGICEINWAFILNLFTAILIMVDMMLFIMTDGDIEEAGRRPHNIGDNMLDAFQDFHFWFKLIGFVMMVLSTLSLILVPYQCTVPSFWFKLVEIHAAPAYVFIYFSLLVVYPFGEYPSTFLCLVLDLIGAIVISFVGFMQLYETYFRLQTSNRDCYFNATAILNWLIVLVLLLDAVIYIAVDIAMGVERKQRRYDD